ncbi:unnamed protein product [Ranitomeya imitator]|uniref:Protein spinster homolog 1 n=1 Tax=Ranitomeya imitator TaxID=111125 RepID=A0ABN9MEJ1_9NEOB|nr:unnamed protein product [Ranitomeya imitator]
MDLVVTSTENDLIVANHIGRALRLPICSQVLADHVFGYLGDRFNRKNIMCAGMSFWAIMNLCITFIPNEYFHLFLEMRRLLGVLKACFSTMAPSIIADLFVGRQRGCMLSIYYFTAPVGCGLGFIIASTVTRAAGGDWHWAFRVTPGLGLIAVLLIISFVKEPHREIFDRNNNKLPICKTWIMDMKHLLKNKSFMLSTFGNANVTFVTAAITFWAPSFLMLSGAVTKQKEPCQTDVCNYHDSVFGIVAGVKIAEIYKKYDPCGDPKVCAVSLLIGSIFLYLALFLANISFMASYLAIFIVLLLAGSSGTQRERLRTYPIPLRGIDATPLAKNKP